jgi:hypothetical protein
MKFLITAMGKTGLAPRIVETGDRICILYGGRVPFVIREREDGAQWFLGPCYLHDMMERQAIEEKDELGLIEKEFVFK